MKRTFLLMAWLACCSFFPLCAETSLLFHGFQSVPGDTARLTLSVVGEEAITSFEADIVLPMGLTIVEAETVQSDFPATDHMLRMRSLSTGNKVHIACWSPTNALLRHRISLKVAVDRNLRNGSYSLSVSAVLLVTPDGVTLTTENQTVLAEVNANGHSSAFAALLSEAAVSQAWFLKNTDTGFFLSLNRTASTLTLEKQDMSTPCQRFFLEPAYDCDEGLYYLRNADGYYLCCSLNGTAYELSIGNQPDKASAFILTETGDRTYSLTIAGTAKRLTASGTSVGDALRASESSKYFHWQFFPTEADHEVFLSRLCNTAMHYIGWTQGEADFTLRTLCHTLSLALIEGMDDVEAVAAIDALVQAVADARWAYATGDTTHIDVPWLAAERFKASTLVVTTTSADGQLRFLTHTDGQFGLSDQFSILTQDPSAPLWQDAFYNPYIDRSALRLSGEDSEGRSHYLMVNGLSGSVADTTVAVLSECLGQWTVLSLAQAVGYYLTLSGKSGVNVNWDFDLATRTLTFNGALRTHTYTKLESRPWHLYRSLIQHVVFVGQISLLGANLLADCTNLESITFISGIKPSVGEGTFDGIPEPQDIYTTNPDLFDGFLPGCRTHFLVKIREMYTYDGTCQTPVVEGHYDAVVTEGTLQKDAGTYMSVFTIAINIDGKIYEYTGPFAYTILPAPLTLASRDCARTYGDDNPNFRIYVSGLKGDDSEKSVLRTPAFVTCEADRKSPVGAYAILISGAELADSNYVINYQYGTLTVRPKTLSIIADNLTRYVGEPNPIFTYRCIGFVNGDDVSVLTELPMLSCEADSISTPGKYPIFISGGAAPNYSVKTANGILTVMEGSGTVSLVEDNSEGLLQVYDLLGRRVSMDGQSLQLLSPGIYLVNGKKTIIK